MAAGQSKWQVKGTGTAAASSTDAKSTTTGVKAVVPVAAAADKGKDNVPAWLKARQDKEKAEEVRVLGASARD